MSNSNGLNKLSIYLYIHICEYIIIIKGEKVARDLGRVVGDEKWMWCKYNMLTGNYQNKIKVHLHITQNIRNIKFMGSLIIYWMPSTF